MKLVYVCLMACLGCGVTPLFAQSDEALFKEVMRLPRGQSVAETATLIGQHFLEAPYVAGTLESPDGEERLTVNLREFDCATFVESVLALATTRHTKPGDFQAFRQLLRQLRYRRGVVQGYGSRLHYFSDWLGEQQFAGRLAELTQQLGGQTLNKPICFMTTHRRRYAKLSDSLLLAEISGLEKEISRRVLFFIPKNRVAALEGQLQDGDVLGITSSKPGLDVAHEGFVLRREGRAYLLHASSEHGQVMLTTVPLSDYLARNPVHSGIMVARLKNEPTPYTTTNNTN